MYRKRPTYRRRKAPMRRRRAPRKRTTGIRQIEKIDRFVFKPISQYLISNAIGTMTQINPVGTSTNPVNWGTLAAIPSASTIPGYYDFGASCKFNALNLTTFNSLATRYDNYRIREVRLTIDLLCGGAVSAAVDSTSSSSSHPGIFPTIWAFADQDDAAQPTNHTQVATRAGVKRFKFGQNGKMSCSIVVQPKAAVAVGPAGLSVGQAANNLWLDCGDPVLPDYFGLKLWFADVNMDGLTNYGFRCNWSYVLELKGTQNLF